MPATGQGLSDPPVPFVLPGSGWSSPWTPTVQPGECSDAVAIAHWDAMPGQIWWRDDPGVMQLGIIAYHASGIDRVEVAVDGGTRQTVHEMGINPRTMHYAYRFAFDEEDFTNNKAYEVRAEIFPEGPGTSRILTLQFFDGRALRPGVHHAEYWIHAVLGDDLTGDGTAGNPFQTLERSLQAVQTFTPTQVIPRFGTGDGAILNLLTGPHVVDAGTTAIDNTWPLTIRSTLFGTELAAQGVVLWPKRWQVLPPAGGGAYMNVRSLRIEGIPVDVSNSDSETPGNTSGVDVFRVDPSLSFHGDASLYFSQVELKGIALNNDNVQGSPPYGLNTGAWLIEPASYRTPATRSAARVYIEDSLVDNIRGNQPLRQVGWLRNVTVQRTNNGTFQDCEAVIDCLMRQDRTPLDAPGLGGDVPEFLWSIHGQYTSSNALCDSVATESPVCALGIGIFGTSTDPAAPDGNVAVVNSIFVSSSSDNLPYSNLVKTDSVPLRHVVLQHCTFSKEGGGDGVVIFEAVAGDPDDSFPCSLFDANIVTGFTVLGQGLPLCSLPWEGVTLLHDFLHECEEMASWDAPCNWSQGVFSQTFFSGSPRNRVKAGATLKKVMIGDQRHRFAWNAERRFKNTGFTAVGARPQIGE